MKKDGMATKERPLRYVLLIPLLLLAPPAPAKIVYSEFSGYREWPIAAGSMADTEYAVPVYRTWPDKPYDVLGSLKYDDSRKRWNPGDIKSMAKEAKKRGGNAVILRHGSEEGVHALAGMKTPGLAIGNVQQTALVIRFLSREEIAQREAQQKALFKQYLANHPPGDFSEEAGSIALKFLLQSGHAFGDPDFMDKFADLMQRVVQREEGNLNGEWLFKALVKTSGITTSDEKTSFGTVTVQSDGTNMVVVSKEGSVELSVSGACSAARFSGQVGIAGFSAKAEGIALDTKISMTFNAVTSSGTAQGNIVLQRIRRLNSGATPTQQKPL
jgi:hypothetical protein